MTDPRELCEPCKSRGRLSAGKHLVQQGDRQVRKCDQCKAERVRVLQPVGRDRPETHGPKLEEPAAPTSAPELEADRPKPDLRHRVDEMQADRDRGLPVPRIAEIHQVNELFVYNSTTAPAAESEEGTVKGIDWDKVRDERAAGAKVADLAKKYGCSDVTVYANTKGAKPAKAAARSNGKGRPMRTGLDDGPSLPKSKLPRINPARGTDGIVQALAELRGELQQLETRRSTILAAIQILERV